MKKVILVALTICLIFNVSGCGDNSENIIQTVKDLKLAEYPDKTIGSALENYFFDYDLDWTVGRPDNNVYTVEASVSSQTSPIEFKPVNNREDTLFLISISFSFEYDKINNTINNYEIYSVVDNNGKYQSIEKKNEDTSLFFNRIYGIEPDTSEQLQHINSYNTLKEKVENAKSDQEARNIVGNDSSFPLELDYLNENSISKQRIISLIDSLIDTEKEIMNEIKNLYK